MPAYLSTQFDFPLKQREGLVRRVYEALAIAGAPFAKVEPCGCPSDLSFDNIVEWNQAKLTSGFRLGYDEHPSNDYLQILVTLPPFDYARLFLLLGNFGVRFHLLVPASDVYINILGAAALMALGRNLFSLIHPRSIQTCGEISVAVSHRQLVAGRLPSADLFAFLDAQYPEPRSQAFHVESLEGGRLLVPVTGLYS